MHMNEPSQLTYQEFLEFIADKDEQYEYVDGHAVAMGRPSKIHQRIALEIGTELKIHLRGQRCDVYLDTRAWTGARDRVPDITVTCSDHDLDSTDEVLRSPKLVIEILSKNRGDDLDAKIDEYESISAIEEYIVIDSRRRWLRRYYRNDHGKFEFDAVRISGTVRLASVGYTLDIDALYRIVRLQ